METAEWRLPVRRSESPTGYPQQSPLPLHQSPTIVAQSQCGVWLRSSVALIVSAPNGVSSLLCAPGDISILHRHRDSFGANATYQIQKKLPGMRDKDLSLSSFR